MDPLEAGLRLGVALLIGAVIGVERQWLQRMAGLRTNALVAVGAAGFVVFATVAGTGSPTVVAAQIVSGIGFLGAGVILRQGSNISGLNTAATLWCSAMVGTFAGGGHLLLSAIAGAFVVGANLLLRPIVRLINRQPLGNADVETHYAVELRCQGEEEARTRALLLRAASGAGLGLRRLTSENLGSASNPSSPPRIGGPSRWRRRLKAPSPKSPPRGRAHTRARRAPRPSGTRRQHKSAGRP
jgi:putative Mg2+ transporter-C (MgtC) family protein